MTFSILRKRVCTMSTVLTEILGMGGGGFVPPAAGNAGRYILYSR